MCGRYASFRESQDLADAFDVEEMTDAAREVIASWNIAPTDGARVVVARPERRIDSGSDHTAPAPEPGAGVRRELHLARWGLVPAWAKDPRSGARMFNARSETLETKPAFRKSAAMRRCLVLADGYYEWHTEESDSGISKTPFYIHREDRAPIAFAGLYSWWRDPAAADDDPDRWLLSTTIVTAAARDGLEQIHDREPVILAPEVIGPWLDPALVELQDVVGLLAHPCPPLAWYEVSPEVGSVRNDGPELIEPR